MEELTGFVLSAVLQALVFLLIALIAFGVSRLYMRWRKTDRKTISFFHWIGLRPISRAELKRLAPWIILAPVVAVIIDFCFLKLSPSHQEFMRSAASPFGRLWALGLTFGGVVSALFYAFIQTGFSEEVLFRGLLARKLIQTIGAIWGNFLQAIIFSIMHVSLLLASETPFAIEVYVFATVVPFAFALYSMWLNRRASVDTIFPSILTHGLTNFLCFLAYFGTSYLL